MKLTVGPAIRGCLVYSRPTGDQSEKEGVAGDSSVAATLLQYLLQQDLPKAVSLWCILRFRIFGYEKTYLLFFFFVEIVYVIEAIGKRYGTSWFCEETIDIHGASSIAAVYWRTRDGIPTF